MVYLSEVFLGGMQEKYRLSRLNYSLVCVFKKMGRSEMSSIDMGGGEGAGKLLMVKCRPALSN